MMIIPTLLVTGWVALMGLAFFASEVVFPPTPYALVPISTDPLSLMSEWDEEYVDSLDSSSL